MEIEYDTRILQRHFNGHVGLELDWLNSIKTADCMDAGIDLRTGIDYDDGQKDVNLLLTRTQNPPMAGLRNQLDSNLSLSREIFFFLLGFIASTLFHSLYNRDIFAAGFAFMEEKNKRKKQITEKRINAETPKESKDVGQDGFLSEKRKPDECNPSSVGSDLSMDHKSNEQQLPMENVPLSKAVSTKYDEDFYENGKDEMMNIRISMVEDVEHNPENDDAAILREFDEGGFKPVPKPLFSSSFTKLEAGANLKLSNLKRNTWPWDPQSKFEDQTIHPFSDSHLHCDLFGASKVPDSNKESGNEENIIMNAANQEEIATKSDDDDDEVAVVIFPEVAEREAPPIKYREICSSKFVNVHVKVPRTHDKVKNKSKFHPHEKENLTPSVSTHTSIRRNASQKSKIMTSGIKRASQKSNNIVSNITSFVQQKQSASVKRDIKLKALGDIKQEKEKERKMAFKIEKEKAKEMELNKKKKMEEMSKKEAADAAARKTHRGEQVGGVKNAGSKKRSEMVTEIVRQIKNGDVIASVVAEMETDTDPSHTRPASCYKPKGRTHFKSQLVGGGDT